MNAKRANDKEKWQEAETDRLAKAAREAALPAGLKQTLVHLNWNYGRGEIVDVIHDPAKNTGWAKVKLQYGTGTFSYRIKGQSVHARGHQRKLMQPGEEFWSERNLPKRLSA